MRLVVVAVGRVKDKPLRAATDEYLSRVRRYVACEEIELKDEPGPKLTQTLGRITEGASVVAMEVGGRVLDSPAFAVGVERLGARGKGIVAFVLGGADGIPPEFSRSATERWSLSALTFPHRLARLVLVEQLYRAMSILRNEPYAH